MSINILASTSMDEVGHGLLIFFGLMSCFFGWRFFRSALISYGFISGAILGLVLADIFFTRELFIFLAAAIVVGLGIALLAYKIFKLALFFNGFALGFFLGLPLGYAFLPEWAYLAAVGLGLLLGFIFIFSHKSVMILSLALIGAYLTVYGFAFFAGYTYLSDVFSAPTIRESMKRLYDFGNQPILMFLASVLGAAGVFAQCNIDEGSKATV